MGVSGNAFSLFIPSVALWLCGYTRLITASFKFASFRT